MFPRHPLQTQSFAARLRQCISRRTLWLCLLALVLTGASATVNYNRLEQLARERYGAYGVEVMQDWQTMLNHGRSLDEREKLQLVNQFFNSRIRFTDDIAAWGKKDYWATPLESLGRGRGDCEDYSIGKYVSLQLLGVPIERLRMIYVKARIGGPYSNLTQAHMVLGYYPGPGADPLILDNLIPQIRPASRRKDLTPVFGFNSAGLWVGGATNPSSNDPAARLSRWRDLLFRMQQEGLQ